MRKEITGFAAFETESGKGLAVTFGSVTKTALTDDPEKVYLADSVENLKTYISWFNGTHKNKKAFEIREVTYAVKIKIL